MQIAGFFPLNDSRNDANVRGESPLGFSIYSNVSAGAMTAGAVSFDVAAPFGKGLGEVIGATLLGTVGGAANMALTIKAAASSTAGNVTVTLQSTDAADIANHAVSFILYGKLLAYEVTDPLQ